MFGVRIERQVQDNKDEKQKRVTPFGGKLYLGVSN